MSRGWREKEIVGAIFPVLPEHVPNLFDRGRDVFVKFTKLTKLTTGSTIIFYVSGEKVLVGEGRVKVIEKLSPELAWSQYGDRVFLDEEEFDSYVRISPITREERRMRKLDVFVLDNVKKYGKPFRSIYPVTASGRYLSREMVDKIRKLSLS